MLQRYSVHEQMQKLGFFAGGYKRQIIFRIMKEIHDIVILKIKEFRLKGYMIILFYRIKRSYIYPRLRRLLINKNNMLSGSLFWIRLNSSDRVTFVYKIIQWQEKTNRASLQTIKNLRVKAFFDKLYSKKS